MSRICSALALSILCLVGTPAFAVDQNGMSLTNLSDVWTGSDGRKATLARVLDGRPTVLALFYSGCSSLCPLIVEQMRSIEEALPEDRRRHVHFVLMSLDSTFETPESLRAFAANRGIDPSRWGLYRGDETAVRQLAMALSISFRPDGSGGFDHANLLSIIDASGTLRYQQPAAGSSMAPMVERLLALER